MIARKVYYPGCLCEYTRWVNGVIGQINGTFMPYLVDGYWCGADEIKPVNRITWRGKEV
ncbi:hypothetical protein KAR91_09285 [Candidatus Pacearchaeota archaeon]|nr:hypothetical protein [Candidatus Pacearchaeota archaeon]